MGGSTQIKVLSITLQSFAQLPYRLLMKTINEFFDVI